MRQHLTPQVGRVVFGCALVATAVLGTNISPAVSVSTSAITKTEQATLTPLAGSGRYLVYASFTHGRLGYGNHVTHGQLLVKPLHGKTRTLATITNDARLFSMSRSMLVYSDGLAHPIMHWINLSSGRSGTFKPHMYDAAAPHGWFYLKLAEPPPQVGNAPQVLYEHVIGGKTTRLGIPLKGSQFAHLTVGPDDVAISEPAPDDARGLAAVMAFAQPGRFHQLIKEHTAARSYCWTLTSSKMTCAVTAEHLNRIRVYDLRTDKILINRPSLPCFSASPIDLLHGAIAWIRRKGCGNQIEDIDAAGHTQTSKRAFDPHTLVTALGGVAAATPSLHTLALFFGLGHSQLIAGT